MTTHHPTPPLALLLRGEAFCALLAACSSYRWLFPHHGAGFLCLFLLPDLGLLPYAKGPGATAALAYNLTHTYVAPALLGALALATATPAMGQLSVVWVAHIALDRLLGLGLKFPHSIGITHLQSVACPPAVPGPGRRERTAPIAATPETPLPRSL